MRYLWCAGAWCCFAPCAGVCNECSVRQGYKTVKTPAELPCNANSQFLRELGPYAYRLKSCSGAEM